MRESKKISKLEVEDKIKEIFERNPSPSEIKKVKRLATSKNIKLGDYKKKFCRKCLSWFDSGNCEVRIKGSLKVVRCLNCGYVGRYKIK
ncbi:hypothetical protein CMI42_01170 [Candidatus Pacearchaeota archaeon]|jgi:RNase P subunit RPR2|nr:hypothetical protein [Candidatus Pacearchaeota archaeon]|tara:strand:- start:1620 stop:1886 length:267 start_codon:yes stop_codon:yes gene_type:complete